MQQPHKALTMCWRRSSAQQCDCVHAWCMCRLLLRLIWLSGGASRHTTQPHTCCRVHSSRCWGLTPASRAAWWTQAGSGENRVAAAHTRRQCGLPSALSPACKVVWCFCLQHVCLRCEHPLLSPPCMFDFRVDFNLNRPVMPAEISEVERLVNSWVAAASPTAVAEMELDAARAAGATAMFGEKYDDVVRVVEVPGVSMELCGGE